MPAPPAPGGVALPGPPGVGRESPPWRAPSPTVPTHPTAKPTETSIQTGRRVLIAGVTSTRRGRAFAIAPVYGFLTGKAVRRSESAGPAHARVEQGPPLGCGQLGRLRADEAAHPARGSA